MVKELFTAFCYGVTICVLVASIFLLMAYAVNENDVELTQEPVPAPTITVTVTPAPPSPEVSTCKIDSSELAKALNEYTSNKVNFENDLMEIINKIEAPCRKCTKRERKAILQVKMMLALRAGKRQQAQI